MRQIGYAAAFALVLVGIVAGAFFGGRFVLQRSRQDFQFRREWTPPDLSTPATTDVLPPAETVAPTPRPTPTQILVPTPIVPTPEPFAAADTPAPPATPVLSVTDGEVVVLTPPEDIATPLPTPVPAEPYQAVGGVRTSLGDCGGILVLGLVSDSRGAPLPGVRLRLVDDFGNEAIAVTKAEQADLGRFDFPVSGPPRGFSLTIIDETGAALSRPASFAFYGNAPDAQATCYWVDWLRQ